MLQILVGKRFQKMVKMEWNDEWTKWTNGQMWEKKMDKAWEKTLVRHHSKIKQTLFVHTDILFLQFLHSHGFMIFGDF